MLTRRIDLTCIVLSFLFLAPTLSCATDLTSIVDVSIYERNSDYLEFVIHLTKLPNYFVVRELLCTVRMTTPASPEVIETFQLTEVPPHFYEYDPADKVLYVPHKQNRPRVVKETCVGTSLFASGESLDPGGLNTGVGRVQTESTQSGTKALVYRATDASGNVVSSAKIIAGIGSKSPDEQELLDAVSRLGDVQLYEPTARDVKHALTSHHLAGTHLDESPSKHPETALPNSSPPPDAMILPGTGGQIGAGETIRSESGAGSPYSGALMARPDAGSITLSAPSAKPASATIPTDAGRIPPRDDPAPAAAKGLDTAPMPNEAPKPAGDPQQVLPLADAEARQAKKDADARAKQAKQDAAAARRAAKEAEDADKPPKAKHSKKSSTDPPE